MYSWLQNPGSGERIVLLGKLSSMSADLVKEREKDCERQSRKDGPRGGQPLPCYLYNKIDPRLPCLSDLLPVFQGNFQSDITATFLLFSSHFLFFFEKYAKQADSIHCIFSNELFPRNISCGLCVLTALMSAPNTLMSNLAHNRYSFNKCVEQVNASVGQNWV